MSLTAPNQPPPADPDDGVSAGAVTLRIESMGALGDGIASDGAFAPLTLPGERVLCRVEGGRAAVLRILEASSERVEPPCPHFGDCGGCSFQHWSARAYLAWKAEQIRAALARVGIETDILAPFAAPAGSRRRLALHARRDGRDVVLGFKARRSWRLAPIEACVIADPRLVAMLPALRRLAAPFLEHPKSAPTLHVTLTDSGLDVDVTGVEARSGGLSADARRRAAQLAAEADIARVSLAGEVLFQQRSALVRLGPATISLPPGAFLQAVPQAERAMAEFVSLAMAGSRRIADLYCGVGTFSFHLARIAPVLAIDGSPAAVAALSAGLASAPGLRSIQAEARDLDRRPVLAEDLGKTDAVLFDPPRAGAAAQSAQLARSRVGVVVGVSCHPGTFARDAAALVKGGYRLQRVLPVDQFLWSPHIELVGVFSREGR